METIVFLASVPAVLALTNLAKKLGLKSDFALVLAVALGAVLSAADYLLADSGLYAAISSGLILGLSAAGLYDVSKRGDA